MQRSALDTTSEVAIAIGVAGAIAYIWFSLKSGGFRPLIGAEAIIGTILATLAVILWAGSRMVAWWPPVCFHVAIAGYMSFMGLLAFRHWRNRW